MSALYEYWYDMRYEMAMTSKMWYEYAIMRYEMCRSPTVCTSMRLWDTRLPCYNMLRVPVCDYEIRDVQVTNNMIRVCDYEIRDVQVTNNMIRVCDYEIRAVQGINNMIPVCHYEIRDCHVTICFEYWYAIMGYEMCMWQHRDLHCKAVMCVIRPDFPDASLTARTWEAEGQSLDSWPTAPQANLSPRWEI